MNSRRSMTRTSITILSVAALVVLFTGQVFAKEITVKGRLQRTVEAGGWVISSNDQKYLVLNARRFQKEKWFVEAAEVEAIGEIKSDVMTAQMEGTPFEVRTMRPFAESGSGGSQNESQSESTRLARVLVTGDSIVPAQPACFEGFCNFPYAVVTELTDYV